VKAKDIEPGVIYAYQRGRGEYASIDAVMVLTPATPDNVYHAIESHRPPGTAAFKKAKPGIKPRRGKGWSNSDYGYPAVMGPVDKLAAATLADFEAATSPYHVDGCHFLVLTSTTPLVGPYEEAVAAQQQARAAAQDRREQERAERKADAAKAEGLVAALAKAGVQAQAATDWHPRALTIPLDQAEKLVALLACEEGTFRD
jgi:hypothetical protein